MWSWIRDVLIVVTALALLVVEALGEARPPVLMIFAGLAVGTSVARIERSDRRERQSDEAG